MCTAALVGFQFGRNRSNLYPSNKAVSAANQNHPQSGTFEDFPIVSAIRAFESGERGVVELAHLSSAEKESLLKEATQHIRNNLEPLRDYERHHLEIIDQTADGGSVVAKVPRPPEALYNAIVEKGLSVFADSNPPLSMRALAEAEKIIQDRVKMFNTDQYFVAQTGVGSEILNVTVYHQNAPMSLVIETGAEGEDVIVSTGTLGGQSYFSNSADSEFDGRLGHLFQ